MSNLNSSECRSQKEESSDIEDFEVLWKANGETNGATWSRQVRANDPGMQDLHLESDIQQRMALLEEAESHWAARWPDERISIWIQFDLVGTNHLAIDICWFMMRWQYIPGGDLLSRF